MKSIKIPRLPNKISSCEVSTLKINTVEHDANSVLEGLTLLLNVMNTVIKYYEHTIQGHHFKLASVSKNSILF